MTPIGQHGDAPLYLVDLHYFSTPRDLWELAMTRARQLGASGVATPLLLAWHTAAPAQFDLGGATDPRRNLRGFVELCRRVGLTIVLTLAAPSASGAAEPVSHLSEAHALGESIWHLAAAHATGVPALRNDWSVVLSAALLPLQQPTGPIAELRLSPADRLAAEQLRQEGWTIPIVEARPVPPPGPTAQPIARSSPKTLAIANAPRALASLIRDDGSARPLFWRLKMIHMLLGSARADFARARPPADLAFDDFDAPAAWADGEGIRLDIRYGQLYTYLFVENTRATNYTGILGYRAPDSSVLHLHIGLGAKRCGIVLLRGDEVAGIAVDGDASEGGWLARGLSTSAMFSSGGGAIPCGRGLMLTAPQSGRFQLRRAEGWADMLAHRLLLNGDLLPATLQIDATHLSVPYVAEDERGQTDMYLVQPRAGDLPEELRGYLSALLAGRAAALDRAAELAAEYYPAAARAFTAAADALDTAADLRSLSAYATSRQIADQSLAPAMAELRQALDDERSRRLTGVSIPQGDERASMLARILLIAEQ